jgi:probable phosphoglycerate mutase
MDWGAWEGYTVAELRALHGDGMAQNERSGLDFRPEGGESPRDVALRLGNWLKTLAAAGQPAVAVTHKGVIRAALSLATGWDMKDCPPVRLEWSAAHLFSCDRAGVLRLARPNISMAGR